MTLTRRQAIAAIGAPAVLRRARAAGPELEIAAGPFKGARESLRDYRVPAWYHDAKFGIWAHWGPQSAAEAGDWYARNMYIQGQRQYNYHVKTYGHPSKFGFKDVIATWKADQFDPDHLMQLYKKAGAKYFCSMGVHHDGFDLWKSAHQPRWNAVASGPKIDVVGLWKKAAQKHGLRFAVSEHLAPSYHWFSVAHTSDKTGPLAGVPYDGVDPAYKDLYHEYAKDYDFSASGNAWRPDVPDSWKLHYFKRIKDLIDNYAPDLLYTDGGIFYEEYGLHLVAHLYNTNAKLHGGRVEAVYTSKTPGDCETGTCVLDLERGVAGGIPANPWQTDTCIGDWHYNRQARYKTPKRVIDMLVDIVSRNGNLMLNFPLPNSGALDDQELKILDEITRWMAVNSEGIYSTRPWKVFGDGPVASAPAASGRRSSFNEANRKDLTAEEVRFTTKGNTLYAFVMGWPEKQAVIRTLATTSSVAQTKVKNVELLGFKGKVKWTQDEKGLTVQMPEQEPCDHAITLKIAV